MTHHESSKTPLEKNIHPELWDIAYEEEIPHSDVINSFNPSPDKEQQHKNDPLRRFQTNECITLPSSPRAAIFSFFSGAGFLDLGFEASGFNVVYANEYFAPFLEAYIYARKNLNMASSGYGYYGKSVTDFLEQAKRQYLTELVRDAHKTHDIVGFIGGPPCPDFSIGGKNRGREGDNGKLSATYIELICHQKPEFYLFENVKGLWNTKRHREFYEEIKKKTQEYYVTTEILTNALEYGVPQDRDRIILLGFRKDLMSNIFRTKTGTIDFPWKKHAVYPIERVFNCSWPVTNPFEPDSIVSYSQDTIRELTVEYWFNKNDTLNHPNAEQFFKPKAGLKRFASIPEGDDSRKSFKRLHRWRYSPTAAYGNNEVHLHPYKIRRISVAEALAIQSLPKDFVLPSSMTLTNAFKATGNGVPFLMAQALAQTILEFLGGLNAKINSIQYSDGNRPVTEEPGLPIY